MTFQSLMNEMNAQDEKEFENMIRARDLTSKEQVHRQSEMQVAAMKSKLVSDEKKAKETKVEYEKMKQQAMELKNASRDPAHHDMIARKKVADSLMQKISNATEIQTRNLDDENGANNLIAELEEKMKTLDVHIEAANMQVAASTACDYEGRAKELLAEGNHYPEFEIVSVSQPVFIRVVGEAEDDYSSEDHYKTAMKTNNISNTTSAWNVHASGGGWGLSGAAAFSYEGSGSNRKSEQSSSHNEKLGQTKSFVKVKKTTLQLLRFTVQSLKMSVRLEEALKKMAAKDDHAVEQYNRLDIPGLLLARQWGMGGSFSMEMTYSSDTNMDLSQWKVAAAEADEKAHSAGASFFVFGLAGGGGGSVGAGLATSKETARAENSAKTTTSAKVSRTVKYSAEGPRAGTDTDAMELRLYQHPNTDMALFPAVETQGSQVRPCAKLRPLTVTDAIADAIGQLEKDGRSKGEVQVFRQGLAELANFLAEAELAKSTSTGDAKHFEMQHPFDGNGILYYLGTGCDTRGYTNPHVSNVVTVKMSSTHRQPKDFCAVPLRTYYRQLPEPLYTR